MKLNYDKKNLAADFELLGLVLLALVVFGFYGPTAEMSSWQGVNYSTIFLTHFDRLVEFSTIFIVFYQLAFYIPVIITLLVRFKIGPDLVVFQKIVAALVVLLIANYVIYLIWPTNAYALFDPPKITGAGVLDSMTRWVFANIEAWCANPSLHIGLGWFFFRFFATYYRRWWQWLIYLFWFLGMALGTLTLKVHILVNVLTGVLLTELIYQVFVVHFPDKPFERFNAVITAKQKLIIYLILLVALATILISFWKIVGIQNIINS